MCNALLLFSKLCHDQADKDTPLKANILLNNYQDSLMGFQQMSEHSQGQKAPIKRYGRASLVAQWLRVCLPMQGTRVRALVWEDPTCRGAAGPVSHNY